MNSSCRIHIKIKVINKYFLSSILRCLVSCPTKELKSRKTAENASLISIHLVFWTIKNVSHKQWTGFTDIMTCHSRNNTGGLNNSNNSYSVPITLTVKLHNSRNSSLIECSNHLFPATTWQNECNFFSITRSYLRPIQHEVFIMSISCQI